MLTETYNFQNNFSEKLYLIDMTASNGTRENMENLVPRFIVPVSPFSDTETNMIRKLISSSTFNSILPVGEILVDVYLDQEVEVVFKHPSKKSYYLDAEIKFKGKRQHKIVIDNFAFEDF